jgi:hypothetical protein
MKGDQSRIAKVCPSLVPLLIPSSQFRDNYISEGSPFLKSDDKCSLDNFSLKKGLTREGAQSRESGPYSTNT